MERRFSRRAERGAGESVSAEQWFPAYPSLCHRTSESAFVRNRRGFFPSGAAFERMAPRLRSVCPPGLPGPLCPRSVGRPRLRFGGVKHGAPDAHGSHTLPFAGGSQEPPRSPLGARMGVRSGGGGAGVRQAPHCLPGGAAVPCAAAGPGQGALPAGSCGGLGRGASERSPAGGR